MDATSTCSIVEWECGGGGGDGSELAQQTTNDSRWCLATAAEHAPVVGDGDADGSNCDAVVRRDGGIKHEQ